MSLFSAGMRVLVAFTAATAAAQPTISISGDLYTSSGKPSAIYTVELTSLTVNLPIERAFSNSDGKFEFHNVKAGTYTILVKTDSGDVVGFHQMTDAMGNMPVRIQVTEQPKSKAITGTVSAITLQHHPPKESRSGGRRGDQGDGSWQGRRGGESSAYCHPH